MGPVFVGFIVVWGAITGLTRGNWQAGLMVALVVMSMMISDHRAQQRAAKAPAPRRLVIVEEEPEPQPVRRGWRWL